MNAASIDTNEPVRDERIRRSEEFFDIERFPQISYAARHITHADHRIVIVGDLTIRGITRELELRGQTTDPFRDAWRQRQDHARLTRRARS